MTKTTKEKQGNGNLEQSEEYRNKRKNVNCQSYQKITLNNKKGSRYR